MTEQGTIVVFGGDRDLRRSTQRALAHEGFRVRVASSAAELRKALTDDTTLMVALSPVQGAPVQDAPCRTLSVPPNESTDAIVDRVRRALSSDD